MQRTHQAVEKEAQDLKTYTVLLKTQYRQEAILEEHLFPLLSFFTKLALDEELGDGCS